jgi:hypothetical protein
MSVTHLRAHTQAHLLRSAAMAMPRAAAVMFLCLASLAGAGNALDLGLIDFGCVATEFVAAQNAAHAGPHSCAAQIAAFALLFELTDVHFPLSSGW